MLLAMPSSGLEPETSPLPRECSTAEQKGQFKSGPGWTIHDYLQQSNSEMCRINLDGLFVAVKLLLGSAVIIVQSTCLFINAYFVFFHNEEFLERNKQSI